ncbi:unnamed protein product [Blepharisma stoltei]|uniref:Uncharacterized protein n=1 Tax=Blepharisma stoltei TaxID=1481888 RepID=A0AAU9JZY1_9CILI|nr:unnamed protein product [Blepharisma stoltei]
MVNTSNIPEYRIINFLMPIKKKLVAFYLNIIEITIDQVLKIKSILRFLILIVKTFLNLFNKLFYIFYL